MLEVKFFTRTLMKSKDGFIHKHLIFFIFAACALEYI